MLFSLLVSVKTSMRSFFNKQIIFLKFEKSNTDTLLLRFTILSLYYIYYSDHHRRSMESLLYKHTDGDQIHLHALHRHISSPGQIRFLIQCSVSRLLLLRSCKMVGIPFCCVIINQCSQ